MKSTRQSQEERPEGKEWEVEEMKAQPFVLVGRERSAFFLCSSSFYEQLFFRVNVFVRKERE